MKHIYTLLFIAVLALQQVSAKQVPLQDAKAYATAAFELYSGQNNSKKSIQILDHKVKQHKTQTSYYVFNFKRGGYIVLSAEDSYNAVLAFSDEGQINLSRDFENTGIWGELSRHEQNIEYGRQRKLKSNSKVQSEWKTIRAISEGKSYKKNLSFNPVVSPLTTTKWNQSGFYSQSCPADTSGVDGNTYCGCLPIAASQLMRFYENEAPGNGYVSYNDPIYGPQEVNLCGQNFDWANMPDTLAEHNETVADFIYDVGKSMETHYSTSYTGTYVSKFRDALVYYFGFDKSMKSYFGTDEESYSYVLKKEFDEGRIVFLSAWSVDSLYFADIGHTWIADGYGYAADTGAEYMHFNWGWGGANNGWFLDTPGFWVPHEDNPEQASISYYWYRYTLYNIFPAGEDCQSPDANVVQVEPADNYAWMYYRSPIDEEVRFRFRETGSGEWKTTDGTFETHTFAGGLKKGTDYEYQFSRNCCGDWSSFSESFAFTTEGISPEGPGDNADCAVEDEGSLFTTSVSETFAYIYTKRPHGAVNNQFRYRVTGEGDWKESDINTTHYLALNNLSAGTNYEFQVRHECSLGAWSDYSKSQTFSTTGTVESDCATEESASLFTSSISESFAYIYTARPHGAVNNQFRYRVEGGGEWIVSPVNSTHFYALRDLTANTNYEFQVRHECSLDNWSEYSESAKFTTTRGN